MSGPQTACATVGTALALALVAIAGAAPSAPSTSDQQFVSLLAGVRAQTRSALRHLAGSPPTIDNVTRARAELAAAQKRLKAASALVPRTVGGAKDEDVTDGLESARAVTGQALSDVKKSSYDRARAALAEAVAAETSSLQAFGAPVVKQFQAFAVYRDLTNIEGWEEYLGLTARVNLPVTKIVIGIAGRETANTGEPGGSRRAPSIPITKMALYTLQEPSGAYSSGWCRLVKGILLCKLNRTMAANESFAVSFGPLVPAGTQFLVKFWSEDGKRSHAIMTTR